MDQRIIDLYDRFTHGALGRREFMERLSGLAGSAAAAAALLPLLSNNYAQAAIVAPDDGRLAVEKVAYAAPDGQIRCYLAKAKQGAAKRPAVIVIHENRGLNPHIEDVTRRMALEGFLALGVDLLSPTGGTPADEDKARAMIGELNPEENLKRLAAAVPYLAGRPDSTGAVGAIGFCWGGGMVNQLATASPDLKAGVAYYGRQVDAARTAKIKAALLLHYASNDPGINAGIEAYEAALKAAGVRYEKHMYEGAQHAFNNDTNAARYDKNTADMAWGRTVAFLKKHLG
ncbi:MAG: dienelactone hydrolase family protein [Rhodospirillales bacterium]